MIPLRDINPTRSRPVLTYALIAANVMVWLYQVSLGPEGLRAFIHRYGVVPYALTQQGDLGSWITPFTSMFMHGGWIHLISNMWFLYIFGDNIEDRLGKARYLFFYVLSGLGAVVGQVLIDPASPIPMVGASGSISGVLAGYVVLFPHARVLALIPVFFIFLFRELPAVLFIFVWFAIQLVAGVGTLTAAGEATGGVAFFAHIGGFVVGFVLIRLLIPRRHGTHGFQSPIRRSSRSDDPYNHWHP